VRIKFACMPDFFASAAIAFSFSVAKARSHATSTWSKPNGTQNSGWSQLSWSKRAASAAQNYASFTRSLKNIATSLSLPGMSTLASKPVADAVDVECTDDELIVTLVDGRRVSAPLAWFPRLLRATPKQRANWRLIGRGVGIHWDDVDEDISVRSLLVS
jgi:Protein of unknown function (DUF2442)